MKKTITKMVKKIILICISLIFLSNLSKAQVISEGFDDVNLLTGLGWDTINKSSPLGDVSWGQGFPIGSNPLGDFLANSGHDSSYIGVGFSCASATATISDWLLTPPLTISNGDSISFYTRTNSLPSTPPTVYPDRLQVRRSSVVSSNVGASATTVGDFTTLLLDINPTLTTTGYPLVWTQYGMLISGLSVPVSGRFAFRYFVTNGGPDGANSFVIGIDDAEYIPFNVGVNSIDNPTVRLHVYPNPTTEMITLDMGTSLASDATVTICNELGQIVSQGIMNQNTKKHILNVSEFAKGIYAVKIVDGEKNIFKAVFVKN